MAFIRLEALNVGWTNMSRGAVLYLVICLPPSLLKLNLAGCRETLEDEGQSPLLPVYYVVSNDEGHLPVILK